MSSSTFWRLAGVNKHPLDAQDGGILAIQKGRDRSVQDVLHPTAPGFTAAEFRKRKEEVLNRKRKLLDDLAALGRKETQRFEPLKRFLNGSKQMKYVAGNCELNDMRAKLAQVGSNLMVRDRKLYWLPRGAWQLVVDQGSFAHVNAATEISAAAFCGKSHLYPTQCSQWDCTPLRWSLVIFTRQRRRARQGRGVGLGKRTLIY